MRRIGFAMAVAATLFGGSASAQSVEARRFGAREAVEQISLSPDGKRVVFIAPGKGKSSVVYVADVAGGTPYRLMASDGDPEEVSECRWASDSRLVCQILMKIKEEVGLVSYSRMVAVGADGSNPRLLSAPTSYRALGVAQGGGEIIDWLPDSDDAVLMTRIYVPEATPSTRIGDIRQGYGVERVDVATLKRSVVEQPQREAVEFITDGHGTVRIMGLTEPSEVYATGVVRYFYRVQGKRDWKPLSQLGPGEGSGFNPYAIDRELNAVYGFQKLDGRMALYRVSLDGSLKRELIASRPDVDVDGLIRVGRQRRVVGASYATERREAQFFDPGLKALAAALSKALPGLPLIRFVDASEDENRLLLWAGSDVDPGRYYVFDKAAKRLDEIMLTRPDLEKVALAPVKSIRFTAADGTQIPGYLTLPPGSDGKGLPAIVMPHGGPGARDEWGFDWLAQFFAARGYAVLQPNFRGSTGYGDAWFAENGFKSWRTAIGDVNDGGRWLVSQGIAAPERLAIVGWSYGGYAALQSAVLDPTLFKAIVAIAPVTDLERLKEETRAFTNFRLVSEFIGSGPHIEQGSPARNARAIVAPVLMFHGDRDTNVGIAQSKLMEDRLRDAGKRVELVVFPGLDHYLQDSDVRIGMLEKADTFLRESLPR